ARNQRARNLIRRRARPKLQHGRYGLTRWKMSRSSIHGGSFQTRASLVRRFWWTIFPRRCFLRGGAPRRRPHIICGCSIAVDNIASAGGDRNLLKSSDDKRCIVPAEAERVVHGNTNAHVARL